MANTLITPSSVAKEAAMLLVGALVAGAVVHRNFASEFKGAKIGDTITARKPATFTAQEFTTSVTVQNIVQGSASIVLEKHFDVTMELGSKEKALSLAKFNETVLMPAVNALAEKINAYVLSKYDEVPYFYNAGTAASPSFPDTLAECAQINRILNENKCPTDSRVAIVSPAAEATLVAIEAFANADKRGAADTIQTGKIGRVLGVDWFMDQQVPTHTAGSFSTTGTPAINGAVLAGATTMAIDGGAGTETLKKGDVFTVADVTGKYVVTADATATGGAIASVSFYPPAPTGGFPNDKAITVHRSHKANLAFHKNAFTLATVPLELPEGGAKGAYIEYQGLAIRLVVGYSPTSKVETWSLDILCGAKCWQPELACRILEST